MGFMSRASWAQSFSCWEYILWFARKDPGSPALRAIVVGLFIGNALGFIVTLIGQFSSGVNAMGWVGAVLYALLAFGFGYYALKAPREAT